MGERDCIADAALHAHRSLQLVDCGVAAGEQSRLAAACSAVFGERDHDRGAQRLVVNVARRARQATSTGIVPVVEAGDGSTSPTAIESASASERQRVAAAELGQPGDACVDR